MPQGCFRLTVRSYLLMLHAAAVSFLLPRSTRLPQAATVAALPALCYARLRALRCRCGVADTH